VTCRCFELHSAGSIKELNLPGGVPNNQPWIARNSTDSGTSSGPGHRADLRIKSKLLFERERVPAGAVTDRAQNARAPPTPGVIHPEAGVHKRLRVGRFQGLVFNPRASGRDGSWHELRTTGECRLDGFHRLAVFVGQPSIGEE